MTGVPLIRYPPELPITGRVGDIADAIRDSQVIVVAGETGSGKTTQLPKICLELGRGVRGLIGHTQPRRLAARTVAGRLAEELGTTVGALVGYQVRFSRRTGDETMIQLMTDGILLAAIGSDPMLRAYDTLIIDEAHERSLNIDFLIGYLTQLLPRRPDLKVIITSATIDPERFSRHFDNAPILEVSGRSYPVEVRYRPLTEEITAQDEAEDPIGPRDQTQAICDAVAELDRERAGDILVFLSGEREIRDTADALGEMNLRDTEILPLYARLSSAQQQRVFAPHTGRRIVVATNVAETSLTVPGIRYVIDPGTARISRFSTRLKVQRLPIEKISQASADQRKGRCGRLSAGICIRLYSEEDYLDRPRFTDPEILRTSLASVLLQMAALGLGSVEAFGFLDPPDARQVRDGVQVLHELGAIGEVPSGSGSRGAGVSLTGVGRMLGRLPIDPRMARMLVEAERQACLDEMLVITAALSIPDPRLRPPDAQQAADIQHARFAESDSDFLAYLNLWNYLREQQRQLSSSQFRKLCRNEHLHYLRVREWQDLHTQLRRVTSDLGMRRTSSPAEPAAIHRSVLAGLLSHVGMREGARREYLGARGARFSIWPGSALAAQPPQWVVAAELVETSRLWGRAVARIQPEWAERLGQHVVNRSYSEPRWVTRRGGTVASERVTLYGVPLVTSRTVDYGRIDPQVSRELFIRHALVQGEWQTRHAFWHANRRKLADAAGLENKLRRRDVLVDDDELFRFYDERIEHHVVSVRHFDSWWKQTVQKHPDFLDLPNELVFAGADPNSVHRAYPDYWRSDDVHLRLTYRFDPGAAADGVTVHVPLAVLDQLRPEPFSWQVPGLRGELLTQLLRSLPKDVRRKLAPVPATAEALASRLPAANASLLDTLESEIKRLTGAHVPRTAWQLDRVPDYLWPNFRVENGAGRVLGQDSDLSALQRRLRPQLRERLAGAAGLERAGLREWTFGDLPRVFTRDEDGHVLRGYPALVEEGNSVAIRVFTTVREQRRAMWGGTRRLLLLEAGSVLAQVERTLDNPAKLTLAVNPHGSVGALLDDALVCAADELLLRAGGPVWDAAAFTGLLAGFRAELLDVLLGILGQATRILERAADVRERLARGEQQLPGPVVEDMQAQLDGLVHAGFLTAKSARRLPDVARYLEAMQRRLDTLVRDPARDHQRMERIREVQAAHRQLLKRLPADRRGEPAVRELPWMIEELRVSEFAQALGTAQRISRQRVLQALADIHNADAAVAPP